METKDNTDGSANSLRGIIKDVRQKARNKPLMQRALVKVLNMNEETLQKLLNKNGCLKKVVSNVCLEATSSFNTKDFFKTKDKGGIFAYVDGDIFNYFESEVKNSPALELASYEFTEQITEENIIGDAKAGGIYEEVDLAHIKQICERHIIKGEKLLLENGQANLFWVRNTKSGLCRVGVFLHGDGWRVRVYDFPPALEWRAGNRSFFRN